MEHFQKGLQRWDILDSMHMQGGNTETVVVCITFVPTETKEHWLWFCGALSLSCKIEEKACSAVTEVFPGNEHR